MHLARCARPSQILSPPVRPPGSAPWRCPFSPAGIGSTRPSLVHLSASGALQAAENKFFFGSTDRKSPTTLTPQDKNLFAARVATKNPGDSHEQVRLFASLLSLRDWLDSFLARPSLCLWCFASFGKQIFLRKYRPENSYCFAQTSLARNTTFPFAAFRRICFPCLARVERFELPSTVLETAILPLNYTRKPKSEGDSY